MHDYVIVGGGSAGCVLASRLSEDPDVRVLLLEAGPVDDEPAIHRPLGFLHLGGRFDWDYHSAPEPGCGDRPIRLPRGRVIGGCSSTNAMICIRGNPRDYDEWRVPGWSWGDLLPYFVKAEDNARGGSALRGTGGPLAVCDAPEVNEASRAFVHAGTQAGLPLNEDFNGEQQEGVGFFQFTQRDGLRASAADAYLRPARGRANLDVMTDSQVHRVAFEGLRAVGVEASVQGQERLLGAQREVIVCAGAYNSPQLLMLSGLGPARHLRECGLDVLLDREAVGENLSDHAASELLWMTPQPREPHARRRWRSTKLLLATQAGAFASGLAEAGGFARVTPSAPAPEVQFHSVAVRFVDEAAAHPEPHGMWVSPCLLTPASRGSVRLRRDDPVAAPVIRNAFYTAGDDEARMLDGLRLALEICTQPALQPYCVSPVTAPAAATDAALREHLARTTFAFYHPVGTCRMGTDADAVVDPQLRVNGIEALRVVDASVMPSVPRGNTNVPTIALAERAADLIRGGGVHAATSPELLAGTPAAPDRDLAPAASQEVDDLRPA